MALSFIASIFLRLDDCSSNIGDDAGSHVPSEPYYFTFPPGFAILQDGTENSDYMHGAAMGPDGSFVLAAKTFGDWSITNQGEDDFAIVKLDNNGSLLWKWQVRTFSNNY